MNFIKWPVKTIRHSRWKIFKQTAILTGAVLVCKYIFFLMGWEILNLSSFHSSVLAGTIFVLGFILSSTHADYKESEKMPVEITATLASLHQDGILFKKKYPEFRFKEYSELLSSILVLIKEDIRDLTPKAITKLQEMETFIFEMENLGVPPNYMVKIKQEQVVLTKSILRMRYLIKIQPLPSAFLLVEFIVLAVIGILLLTESAKLIDTLVMTGFFSFIYIYLLQLIRIMDLPFQPKGVTQDDVSMFLLDEQQEFFSQVEEKKN